MHLLSKHFLASGAVMVVRVEHGCLHGQPKRAPVKIVVSVGATDYTLLGSGLIANFEVKLEPVIIAITSFTAFELIVIV